MEMPAAGKDEGITLLVLAVGAYGAGALAQATPKKGPAGRIQIITG